MQQRSLVEFTREALKFLFFLFFLFSCTHRFKPPSVRASTLSSGRRLRSNFYEYRFSFAPIPACLLFCIPAVQHGPAADRSFYTGPLKRRRFTITRGRPRIIFPRYYCFSWRDFRSARARAHAPRPHFSIKEISILMEVGRGDNTREHERERGRFVESMKNASH